MVDLNLVMMKADYESHYNKSYKRKEKMITLIDILAQHKEKVWKLKMKIFLQKQKTKSYLYIVLNSKDKEYYKSKELLEEFAKQITTNIKKFDLEWSLSILKFVPTEFLALVCMLQYYFIIMIWIEYILNYNSIIYL